MEQKSKKTFYKILILGGIFFLCWNFFFKNKKPQVLDFKDGQKNIEINDAGKIFDVSSNAATVGELLDQEKIVLGQNDVAVPDVNAKIFSGANVLISRAKKIIIKEGGNTTQTYTLLSSVEQAVWENKIELDEDDITAPERNTPLTDGETIAVTHVLIKQETDDVDVAFKVDTNNDDSLGWRITKITQPGVKGVRENVYKVVYNDGKEISRKLLQSDVTKDPTDQIVTQGTYVKTGKPSIGAASWYAFTGTLAAANPWLPMGSYARVTNQDNGKSVIVKINDRGPFGNGRIIDLDKVAFAQIADLGQGTANVKMEPILN